MLAPGSVIDFAIPNSKTCTVLRPGHACCLKLILILQSLSISFLRSNLLNRCLITLLRRCVLLLIVFALCWWVVIKLVIKPIIEAVVEIVILVCVLRIFGSLRLRSLTFTLLVCISLLFEIILNCLVCLREVVWILKLIRNFDLTYAAIIVHICIHIDLFSFVVGKDVVPNIFFKYLYDFRLYFLEPLVQANILEPLLIFHLLSLISITKVFLDCDAPSRRLCISLIIKEVVVFSF